MPYHGLRFDSGGRCVHNPHGDGTIPRAAKVNAYAVAERYGALWVWMGTADTADAALIPDLSEIGKREGWNVIHGTLKVPAHYELLTDNLLDLSHVAYLHPFLTFSGHWPKDTARNARCSSKEILYGRCTKCLMRR
jgi:vanillate O-demethylase monooxygenase subunit